MESDGERLDEVFESPPDETQDWYFDLPQGAWERQEAKNRDLRQTLLNKQSHQQPQRKQAPEPKSGEKKRRWFGGKDETPAEEAAEKPRFAKLNEETREERHARLEALSAEPDEADAWTTEPDGDDAVDRPLLRRTRSEEEKSAFDDGPPADEPISRWDAMFGSGLREGSIVDGMRQWATSDDSTDGDVVPASGAATSRGAEDDEWDNLDREAGESSMLEALRRRREELAAANAEAVNGDEPGNEGEWKPEDEVEATPVAADAQESDAEPDSADSWEVAPVANLEDDLAPVTASAEWSEEDEEEDEAVSAWVLDVEDDEPAIAPIARESEGETREESPVEQPAAWVVEDEGPNLTLVPSFSRDNDDEDDSFEETASKLVAWPESIEDTTLAETAMATTDAESPFDEAMTASAEFDGGHDDGDEPGAKKPGLLKRLFGRAGSDSEDVSLEPDVDESEGEWVPVDPTPLRPAARSEEPSPFAAPSAKPPDMEEPADFGSPFQAMDDSGWAPVTGDERRELDTSWMAPAGSAARDAAAWSTPSDKLADAEVEEYDEEDPWAPFEQADVENAQNHPGSAALAEEDDDARVAAVFGNPADSVVEEVEEHRPASRSALDAADVPAADVTDEEDVWSPVEEPMATLDEQDSEDQGQPRAVESTWNPKTFEVDTDEPAPADAFAAAKAERSDGSGTDEVDAWAPLTRESPAFDSAVAFEPLTPEATFEPAREVEETSNWSPEATTVSEVGSLTDDSASAWKLWTQETAETGDTVAPEPALADWSDETSFAQAFEPAGDEPTFGETEPTVVDEAEPAPAVASTLPPDDDDDSWDFAKSLGLSSQDDTAEAAVAEDAPTAAAANVEAVDLDPELDASEVVAGLADPMEQTVTPAVAEVDGPDEEEFDFGAALRAAEDEVELNVVEARDEEPPMAGPLEPAALDTAMATGTPEAVEESAGLPQQSYDKPFVVSEGDDGPAVAPWDGVADSELEAAEGPAVERVVPTWSWNYDRESSEDEEESDSAESTSEPDPWKLLNEDEERAAPAAAVETGDHVAATTADEDADAWAAIADASGYNAEEEFEPPTFGKIVRSPHDDERGSWLADHFPEQAPAPDPVESAFAEHDEEDMERDLVLRAFEAHAATDVDGDEDEPLEPGAFQELFGAEAQGIVDDIINPQEVPSFAKMRLSPQRSAPRGAGRLTGDDDDWVEGSTADDVDGGYMADFADAPFLAGSPKTHDPIEAKTSRTWVRELVETGLLALLVFLSVRASFQNFKVDGSSMSPTLSDGQFLIVNKLVYSEVDVEKLSKYVPLVSAGDDPTRHVFHGPERGDIIVLRDPATPEQDLIKRVIGLPGEKIEVFEGAVYINDQRLEEPYIEAEWGRTGDNYPAVIVPADSYFVMGDNRDNSKDSRSSQIGFIAEDLIIGRAELTYLPFNAFGLIGNGGGHLSEQDGRPRLTSDERPGETVAVAAR